MDLTKVHQANLAILKAIDSICREEGIQYMLDAGTLLGAVRHKGFIPWDDDADVALLRAEYEKFRTACEKELDHSRFYFQDHRNTQGYRWGYGKLRRKGTLFLRATRSICRMSRGSLLISFRWMPYLIPG